MVGASYLVGMADIHVAKGDATFTCIGLGSCIGLALYDAQTNVAGMVHIMLPEKFADKDNERPGKFADTGVPELVNLLVGLGANKARLVAVMAGGAQVFKFGQGTSPIMQIGDRNTTATKQQLQALGIKLKSEDCGGNLGRTVIFGTDTGIVRVRSVSQGERVLCNLKG